ncbi:DNA replication protein [Cronobacter sakazakii]|uniref:DNA replication protein n=1 Tax=Cronobacter sakazakii TaxID=28141 RepID=UPI0009782576|nr:DNA replication protein [Cronobacter sakazakii]EGT4300196.1 DNA replication protein [Cronobacter sakazakii]EGT4342563.1 DNA replication protein [Cronobacter sakazakii]EGT4449046.1 DNA replication protein [Cronobacter sakazakii]EGT4471776.1 DNA replication protein [Cronobacter sakazakii]EMC4307794.1 DNA replication protein [Cronobacter sakazakii]
MGVVKLADYRQQERRVNQQEAAGMGFVSIHRQFMDSRLYKDSQAVHLWVHLILKANHEDAVVNTDVGPVTVERGQMITGRPTLVSETFIPDNKVKSLLRSFEAKGMITVTSMQKKFSLITIVKYDDFQAQNCPTNVQDLSNANASKNAALRAVCPSDVQRLSINNNINNNSLPKGNEYVANEPEEQNQKPVVQKPKISCEEVWQCLKDELPEARGWRCLTDERRNLIRTFWGKANKIARNLDGKPLDMEGFRGYLKYISENCRWMLEDRPDQKTGRTWRRMKFDSFLNSKLYIEVREGDRDDR